MGVQIELVDKLTEFRVRGTGRGSVTGTGYSSYGSIGRYTLTATIFGGGLPEGLDANASGLSWTAGGNATWTGQSAVNHDGTDAAQRGRIDHSQESWMETTVPGPGTLSFWCKVSSESVFDVLEFRVNGIVRSSISGEANWQQRVFAIGAGTNVLRWRYAKNGSVATGLDRGWVDEVVFTSARPVITQHPVTLPALAGMEAALRVTATGQAPLRYQWFRDGLPLARATNSTLTFPSVQFSDAGDYHAVVRNAFGIATTAYGPTGNWDFATIAYSGAGVLPIVAPGARSWINRYDGSSSDETRALAVEAAGQAYVTGPSVVPDGTVDFITLAYSAGGAPGWTNRFSGSGDDTAVAVRVNGAGNVFVTGVSVRGSAEDFATLCYSTNRLAQTTNYFSGPADGRDWPSTRQCLALTPQGVVVAGQGDSGGGNVDFAIVHCAVGHAPYLLTHPASQTNGISGAFGAVQALAYGNGVYVGVGNHAYLLHGESNWGAVFRSTNGYNWRRVHRTPGALTRHVHGVAFAQNRFIAVANQGTLLKSINGFAWWEVQPIPVVGDTNNAWTSRHLGGICFGLEGWIITTSESGLCLRSIDGEQWTELTGTGSPASTPDQGAWQTFHADGKYWFSAYTATYATADETSWTRPVGASRARPSGPVNRADGGVAPL